MKQVMSLFLALGLLGNLNPLTASNGVGEIERGYETLSQYDVESNVPEVVDKPQDEYKDVTGLLYEIKGEEAIVTGYEGDQVSLMIPSMLGNKPVTTIGFMAFYGDAVVESLTIPRGVKRIEGYGLAYMKKLRDLSLPDTLEFIGRSGLCDAKVRDLVLPDSLAEIEDYALQGLGIVDFKMPKAMRRFSPLALSDKELTNRARSVTVPSENQYYTVIDNQLYTKDTGTLVMYMPNSSLSSFTVPSFVDAIGRCAFVNAERLTGVDLGNVRRIGEMAFAYTSISSLDIPASVETMDEKALANMPSLARVNFANAMADIPRGLCLEDALLKNVELSANVATIGDSAFSGCGFSSIDLSRYEALGEIGESSFAGNLSLAKVTLPAKIKVIGKKAFDGDGVLKEVNLPNSLNEIRANAFRGTPIEKTFTPPAGMVCIDEATRSYARECVTWFVMGSRDFSMAYECLDILNQERAKYGLGALAMDESLLEGAMLRAGELSVYWSHTRPDGTSFGTLGNGAEAENIVYGARDAKEAMNILMNSTAHRRQILDDRWNSVGIGIFIVEDHIYWTQDFSSKQAVFKERPDIDVKTYEVHGIKGNGTPRLVENRLTLKTGETRLLSFRIANGVQENPVLAKSFKYETDNGHCEIDENGMIYGIKKGPTEIIARNLSDDTVSFNIHVDVEQGNNVVRKILFINPFDEIRVGERKELDVQVVSDEELKVVFSSSNEEVAFVDQDGFVTGMAEGKAVITATAGNASVFHEIIVTPASEKVRIIDPLLKMKVGERQTLNVLADGVVEYASSDKMVAEVSESGVVYAKNTGTTIISATYHGAKDSFVLTVEGKIESSLRIVEPRQKMRVGEIQEINLALVGASEEDVVFASSDTYVAIVDKAGYVFARNPGKATIYARVDGLQDSFDLTVVDIGVLSFGEFNAVMKVGERQMLTVYEDDEEVEAVLSSSDEAIVYVEGNELIAASQGVAVIKAQYDGKSITVDITVEPQEDPAYCRVFGFCAYEGKDYWFEKGKRQAVKGDPKNIWDEVYGKERGREIYDPESDGWYWLDCIYDGAKASSKEVWMPYIYQEDLKKGKNKEGKWVRYDNTGKMIKGWYNVVDDEAKLYPKQEGNTYYYDLKTGQMSKGWVTIEGKEYYFDEKTGVLTRRKR